MALINNLWIQVVDEDVTRDIESTSHPVEKGLPITDTMKNNPITISLSGNIVNVGNQKASEILDKLRQLQKSGSLITYKGRNTATNMQIQSFDTSHPNTIWGGCSFSMQLKEVRIAKKAYVASSVAKTSGTVELKEGSIVVFTGGSVYVSSDAKKAAANRGRQTCKITKISTASWSIHQYHLISTEKKYPNNVYGWVDKANIEGTGETTNTANAASGDTTKTNKATNGGTQQVTTYWVESTGSAGSQVWHTWKKGDNETKLVEKYSKDGVVQDNGKPITRQYVLTHALNKGKVQSMGSTYSDTYTFFKGKVGDKLFMGYKAVKQQYNAFRQSRLM